MLLKCFGAVSIGSSKKNSTNDGRTSEHSEYDYAKKMSNFSMEMSGQKFM